MEANQILKTFRQVKAGDPVYRMFINASATDFHPDIEEYVAEDYITQYPATGLKLYIHYIDKSIPLKGVMTGYPDDVYTIDRHDNGCYFIEAPSIEGLEKGWDEIWRNYIGMNMNIRASIEYAHRQNAKKGL